ncbi:Lanthionine synthetase C family protein [Carbonactinospora thermoautotrophica]|uniref:Lanthionine synthetase C family protein n=1 Tax=Carbonactinospora thermoautotrophica TaxID=1469144 RepID=A0A132MSP9_9ACTN|nr:lanthionine synthetase C family protein [Carbonactinospora thermoautotrophica]KWX00766.1 Lanthionine synthetase C family protein [Carbonactinospora thermoautotrophica]
MTQTEHTPPPPRDPEPGWGQSLSTGAAGITLLHIEYARTGTDEWETVQEWAAAMTRTPVTAHPDACGLYRGAPAVAFILHAAQQPAYATALSTLDSHIATVTRHRLEAAHKRIDHGQLPPLREFDLITGLTGIGVYLLHRHGGGDLLRDVLSYLVRLTEPLKANGEVLPGWWSSDGPEGRPSRRWPGGHGNLGLAHGIAGPLALLSTAMRRGVTVTGQADAIDRICTWLDQWRSGTGSQVWWPGLISLSEWRTRTVRQPGPQRPAWCYGTPGLARAQQVAALALADRRRQRHAEKALAECIADDSQLSQLSDASLCHGWAGLLQATWRAATEADSDELSTHLPHLHARMEQYLHRHGPPAHDGLLEGMTGVRLARHTMTTNTPPASRWDACLLLDG